MIQGWIRQKFFTPGGKIFDNLFILEDLLL